MVVERIIVAGGSPAPEARIEVALLDLLNWKFRKELFIRQLGDTLSKTGFCILRNTGVDNKTVQAAFAAAINSAVPLHRTCWSSRSQIRRPNCEGLLGEAPERDWSSLTKGLIK